MTKWMFQTRPGPRTASVMMVGFSAGPLVGEPTSTSEIFELRDVARALDPRWFDAFRSGSLRAIAERDLDAATIEALDTADHAYVLRGEITDPADLSYLQIAWAHARDLALRGAGCILDMMAIRWIAADTLPAADSRLDVGREVQIIYETDSNRPDHAHALHTRGMRKFGAPDLVALCADADSDLVSSVIAQLAAAIARGGEIGSPRHGVDIAPGKTWYLVPDEHGLAGLLSLNNEARILVDEHGHDLVGLTRN